MKTDLRFYTVAEIGEGFVYNELDGVWGGMTTEQRRPLLGTKPKQVPA